MWQHACRHTTRWRQNLGDNTAKSGECEKPNRCEGHTSVVGTLMSVDCYDSGTCQPLDYSKATAHSQRAEVLGRFSHFQGCTATVDRVASSTGRLAVLPALYTRFDARAGGGTLQDGHSPLARECSKAGKLEQDTRHCRGFARVRSGLRLAPWNLAFALMQCRVSSIHWLS